MRIVSLWGLFSMSTESVRAKSIVDAGIFLRISSILSQSSPFQLGTVPFESLDVLCMYDQATDIEDGFWQWEVTARLSLEMKGKSASRYRG